MKLEAIYACIEVAKYRRDVALRSSGTVLSVAYDQAGVSHRPGIAVAVSAPVGSGAGVRQGANPSGARLRPSHR